MRRSSSTSKELPAALRHWNLGVGLAIMLGGRAADLLVPERMGRGSDEGRGRTKARSPRSAPPGAA